MEKTRAIKEFERYDGRSARSAIRTKTIVGEYNRYGNYRDNSTATKAGSGCVFDIPAALCATARKQGLDNRGSAVEPFAPDWVPGALRPRDWRTRSARIEVFDWNTEPIDSARRCPMLRAA